MRALAVSAVFLYHLWPHHLTGGYVGVDVFFVISGYLITSHLVGELQNTGRIRVGTFWARRAKRLLPASLLVLLLVSIAVLVWVPRTLWRQFLGEVVASTLYVQNWYLASSSVDYSGADNNPSPVQHFWTLSVEEQFYFVLPLVLIAAAVAARALSRRSASVALLAICLVTAGSFVYSVWFTHWSAGAAYFSTLTRAWEFGLGALVVALPAVRGRVLREVLGAAGLVCVLLAVFLFSAATPFPSYTALLPAGGTAIILWIGAGTFLGATGRLHPVAFLGRTSYAIYLWHWPPIVLLPFIIGAPLTLPTRLAIIVGTLVVAWLSTTYWEDRVRFSPRLLGRARPRVVAAWSAGAMALVLAIPLAGLAVDHTERARLQGVAEAVLDDQPDCFGASALADSCENPELAGVLIPAPADAADDDVNRSECWSRGNDPTLNVCSLGPDSGYERHLLAVGDSHNNALIGAYEEIAETRNWRIDVAGRAGCYWTDAELTQPTEQLAIVCAEWRAQLEDYISETDDLDAIVTTKARRDFETEAVVSPADRPADTVIDGMADAWSARPDVSVPVIALVDNPLLPVPVLPCVEEHGLNAATECAVARETALKPDGLAEAAARADNAHVVDLTDLYCDNEVCAPVVGHALVYRDERGHLTSTYALTVAPFLADELARVMDGAT